MTASTTASRRALDEHKAALRRGGLVIDYPADLYPDGPPRKDAP